MTTMQLDIVVSNAININIHRIGFVKIVIHYN